MTGEVAPSEEPHPFHIALLGALVPDDRSTWAHRRAQLPGQPDAHQGEHEAAAAGLALFVVVLAMSLSRLGRNMRLGDLLSRLQDTTAEIRVRLAVLLLIGFVALAEKVGVEAILGAFLAGAILSPDRPRRP